MVNDTSTLNGALAELGETMAANITTKGVSASASDGLTTLAGKILQISGGGGSTIIFEDTCDSASGLSNYADTSIPLRNSGTNSLTYDSTENAYLLSCTKANSQSMRPINALDGYTGDFKITITSNSDTSHPAPTGLVMYFDDNNWYSIKEGSDRVWTGQKVNGTFSEESKPNHNLQGHLLVNVITVDNTNHTLNIKTYENDTLINYSLRPDYYNTPSYTYNRCGTKKEDCGTCIFYVIVFPFSAVI